MWHTTQIVRLTLPSHTHTALSCCSWMDSFTLPYHASLAEFRSILAECAQNMISQVLWHIFWSFSKKAQQCYSWRHEDSPKVSLMFYFIIHFSFNSLILLAHLYFLQSWNTLIFFYIHFLSLLLWINSYFHNKTYQWKGASRSSSAWRPARTVCVRCGWIQVPGGSSWSWRLAYCLGSGRWRWGTTGCSSECPQLWE